MITTQSNKIMTPEQIKERANKITQLEAKVKNLNHGRLYMIITNEGVYVRHDDCQKMNICDEYKTILQKLFKIVQQDTINEALAEISNLCKE